MRNFILDTGIAGLHMDRKCGVFERAEVENAKGIVTLVLFGRHAKIHAFYNKERIVKTAKFA